MADEEPTLSSADGGLWLQGWCGPVALRRRPPQPLPNLDGDDRVNISTSAAKLAAPRRCHCVLLGPVVSRIDCVGFVSMILDPLWFPLKSMTFPIQIPPHVIWHNHESSSCAEPWHGRYLIKFNHMNAAFLSDPDKPGVWSPGLDVWPNLQLNSGGTTWWQKLQLILYKRPSGGFDDKTA